jgi:Subtilase family
MNSLPCRRSAFRWVLPALVLGFCPSAVRPAPRPGVGQGVLLEMARKGEARVVISLRPSAPPRGAVSGDRPAHRRMGQVLDSLPAGSWSEAKRLQLVPAATARITGRALSRLMEDPRVSRIDLDGTVLGTQFDPLVQIGADRVQALGFSGQGVTVAVLDSGTDPLFNVDLQPSLDGEECFCSNNGGCCPDGSSRESGSAASVTSHGPGVMGIVASQGVVAPLGVAPSVKVVAIRVLDDGLVGTYSDILEAMDWLLENREDVRLVNMSFAAGPFPPDCDHLNAFNEAMAGFSEILRQRGGLIVAAAGNHYSLSYMGSPACVSSVVSVGAVDGTDRVMPFSDAPPSLDILAPGNQVMTTGSYGRIVSLTGTSAAAPHVTGAAALVLSALPELSAQELEERLEKNGVPVLDGRSGRTYPRVDAFQALVLPLEADASPAVLSFRSRGRGLAVRVEPVPPFRAVDLDPSSFTLAVPGEERVPSDAQGTQLGDGDGDGTPDLTLHFDRRRVLRGLNGPGMVVLTVEGSFFSGPDCLGKLSLRLVGDGRSRAASEPSP